MYQSIAGIINQALARNPQMAAALVALEGKSLQLIVHPLPHAILVTIQNSQLSLRAPKGRSNPALPEADLTLEGHGLDLLRLLITAREERNALFQSRLQLTGDVLLAQKMLFIFSGLDLDWESMLASWTGDLFAYRLGSFVKNLRERRKKGDLRFQLTNFLQEEIKLTPPKEEVADFCDAVDALVLDVDRLEARLMRQARD